MPSAILSAKRFAGKSIRTEIRKAIDGETRAKDFRATSRWCVQTAIHVRTTTFQTFVERRSLYLVVFLRLLSGDRSVRLARVTRNLPSENRRQGHPFLNHLVPFVWSLHPKARTHRSIERRAPIAERWSLRLSQFVDHRSDTAGICVSRRFDSPSTVRRVGEKNRLPVRSICSSIRSTLRATSRQ